MTKQEKVAAFMEAHGFVFITPKYTPQSASWRGNGLSFTPDQATFFYELMGLTRIDEATRALEVAVNKSTESGQQVVNVLADRVSHLIKQDWPMPQTERTTR